MKVSPITLSFAILGHARGSKQHLRQEGRDVESSTVIENRIDMCIANVGGAACIAECIQSNDPDTCLGACTTLGFPSPSTDGIAGFNEIYSMLVIQGASGLAPVTQIPVPALGDLFPSISNSPLSESTLNFLGLPLGTPEAFEWRANKLPARYDENNAQCFGVPPNYDRGNPASSLIGMEPPFFHETEDVSSYGYRKWPAVPACFTTFAGINPSEFKSDSDLTSLFTKNLEDRGNDNELKRKYMSALTCDKLFNYEAKVEKALRDFLHEIKKDPTKPLLSTWKARVDDLFLDIHFGSKNHPEYVRQYFRRSFKTVANLNGVCDPRNPDTDTIFSAFCEVKEVKNYIQDRIDAVVADNDQTSIIYWWNKAGLSPLAIIQESVHNVLAFGGLPAILYHLIASKVQGRVAIENLLEGSVQDLSTLKLDFFMKYKEASSEADRFSVVREAFRLTLPSALSFSHLEDSSNANYNNKSYDDPSFDHRKTAHIPLILQAVNDDSYNPTTYQTHAYDFDAGRYESSGFDAARASAKCPFAKNIFADDDLLTPDDFFVSSVDAETMIPRGHEKLIPVYDRPQYAPFGLGYRRCPAELFNYMIMDKILGSLTDLEFKVEGAYSDLTSEQLGGGIPCDDLIAVPASLSCRPDNLFLKVD